METWLGVAEERGSPPRGVDGSATRWESGWGVPVACGVDAHFVEEESFAATGDDSTKNVVRKTRVFMRMRNVSISIIMSSASKAGKLYH